MAETFKVKLEGPGVSIDREVEQSIAQKILLLLFSPMGATPEVVSGAPEVNDLACPSPLGLTARETLSHYSARKIPQQIIALGHYLKEKDKKDTFNLEELIQAFEDAKEPSPANPHRDIANTIKLGWISKKSGEKGLYFVTGTGLRELESKFASPKKTHKRKKAKL